MKGKRILLIADSDALWTWRFIEYLLLPEDYEIVIFPIWGHSGRFDEEYKAHGITVYQDRHTLPIIRHIPRLRMWVRIALNTRDLKVLGPFDIIHNHYLSQRDLSLGLRLHKQFNARWLCGFWGSDLMRSSKLELKRMAPYLERCDGIVVHSELNRQMIRQIYGDTVATKTSLCYFGQIGYHNIDMVRERMTKDECKQSFDIAPSRYVICVGYSASSAQQQLPVLEAMAALPKERMERITVVLQQTYTQNDPDYASRVRECAGRLGCQTVALTSFMDGEACARLRIAADMFILAITTDAFSGTLQEYLYAGADVVKGDWLGYPQLDDMGVQVTDFHDYAEIPALIERGMEHQLPSLTADQRAMFPKLYSWEAVKDGWLSLY